MRVWLAGLDTAVSEVKLATQPVILYAAVAGVAILCLAGANPEGQ